MRIAVVSSFGICPERFDGPAICIYNLVREWSTLVKECHLFVGTRRPDLLADEFTQLGLHVHPIRKNWGWIQSLDAMSRYVSSPLTVISLLLALPYTTMQVFMKLREIRPDVVIYNALSLDPLALLPFLMKFLRTPQVVRLPVYFPSELKTMTRSRVIVTAGTLIYKAMIRQMDLIIVNSERAREEVSENIPVPTAVVPNGAPLVPSPTVFSSAHPTVSKGRFTILYAGRVSEEKGIECLVKAIAVLAGSLQAVTRAQVIGEGSPSYVERIRRLLVRLGIHNIVSIAGPIDYRQMWRHYAQADVFVLASCREGMPLALLEAMAYGKAVIATKVGGIPEVIQHGVNGLLFDPGDYRTLAHYLANLAGDRELRARLGSNAHGTATLMSWPVVARRYVALFAALRSRLKASKKNVFD